MAGLRSEWHRLRAVLAHKAQRQCFRERPRLRSEAGHMGMHLRLDAPELAEAVEALQGDFLGELLEPFGNLVRILVRQAPELPMERAGLGEDVPCGAAGNHAYMHGRVGWIEAPGRVAA